AVNAMTMTPARAAWIFGGRKAASVGQASSLPEKARQASSLPHRHGNEGKEALPWRFFGLLGGVATVWLLTPVLGPRLGLRVGELATGENPGGLKASLVSWGAYLVLFLPGALAGGALGWLLIRPVNWALGKFFGAFNLFFDQVTHAYGKSV